LKKVQPSSFSLADNLDHFDKMMRISLLSSWMIMKFILPGLLGSDESCVVQAWATAAVTPTKTNFNMKQPVTSFLFRWHQPRKNLPSPRSASLSSSLENEQLSVPCASSLEQSKNVVDWDWKALAYQVFENDTTPILLFDGLCNFCNGGVNLCLDWDQACYHEDDQLLLKKSGSLSSSQTTTSTKTYTYRYASLQSRVGQSLLLQHNKAHDDWSSLVLVQSPSQAYFESDAVLRVAQGLPGLPTPVRWLSLWTRKLIPKPLRDMLYEMVATQRYRLGGKRDGEEEMSTSCRIDWDGTLQQRFVPDPDEDELKRFQIKCTSTTVSTTTEQANGSDKQ